MDNKLVYIKCPIDFWGYDNKKNPVIIIKKDSTITTETLTLAQRFLVSYEELIRRIGMIEDIKKRKDLLKKVQEELKKSHSINSTENSAKKR